MSMNYVFRFIDKENEPTGYYGFISASNADDLFWGIDIYGDPYSIELIRIKREISMCLYIGEEYFDQDEEHEDLSVEDCHSGMEYSASFLNGIMDLFENKITKKYPHWKKDERGNIESVALKDHRQ